MPWPPLVALAWRALAPLMTFAWRTLAPWAPRALALLMASARNVPQAHAALVQGRWERSRWEGVELADKTLGVFGLGRIGKLVAQRALAFGMRLVAYDPFVSEERARQMNVEMMSLDDVIAQSDFITVHLPKTMNLFTHITDY